MMPAMPKSTRRASSPWSKLARRAAVGVLALSAAAAPRTARAADDDEDKGYDARAQGYTPDVEVKKVGSGGTWLLLILLGASTVGVMFMDAKRSHLD